MILSDLLRFVMDVTKTPSKVCADALGLSPQNFGQRLKRGTLSLEQIAEAVNVCGCILRISVDAGEHTIYAASSEDL